MFAVDYNPAMNRSHQSVAGNSSLKTQGELESSVCCGVSQFQREYLGRGPKDVHAHLVRDLLVVRLKGVLTVAERQLSEAPAAEKERDLLKQARACLIEAARPALASMIGGIAGVRVINMHHDVSTLDDEEIMVFTLADSPLVRDPKHR